MKDMLTIYGVTKEIEELIVKNNNLKKYIRCLTKYVCQNAKSTADYFTKFAIKNGKSF
jgi:hypothetical protein